MGNISRSSAVPFFRILVAPGMRLVSVAITVLLVDLAGFSSCYLENLQSSILLIF